MVSIVLLLILMGVLRIPLPILLIWVAAAGVATPKLDLYSDLPSALWQVATHWQTLLNV